MSVFKLIDIKLTELSIKLNARLTKDRPNYPEALRTFEERRIDWIENQINKAIIIQPNFEITGANSNIWNFINIAWSDELDSSIHPKWNKILVDKGEFKIIEENIDELLSESETNLINIRKEDLK